MPEALDLVRIAILFILDDLNPVVVRVKDKGHIFHSSVCKPLLPIDVQ